MRIERRLLAGTPFAESWLRGDESARELLPIDPREMASYRDKAAEVDARFDSAAREASAAHLFAGGPGARARIAAFVREGGFMVTTGQQPGIFGGPLFALYKAVTAAALARRLEGELGRPVLPVFWIASEHHVWEELATAHVIDAENELHELILPPPREARGRPVHRAAMGPGLPEVLDRFLSLHPASDFLPRWEALLREAYTPEASLAEGFARVMEELLEGSGVFLVFAHEPTLKERSLPILLQELRESEVRERTLDAFDARVRGLGFDPQVPVLEGATNLFLEGGTGRERIFRDGSGLRLRGSEKRFTFEEIESMAHDDPSLLSPNVLLRPVVEGALLPTLSYVAGPGEMAYLPQAGPVFTAHGIRAPVVHPRAALWILETKVSKVLRKFELEIEDLALPHHELAGRLARGEMPNAVQTALEAARDTLRGSARTLSDAVATIDPTLRGPIEAFESQGGQLLVEIERKIVQSLKRENEVALAQAAKAQAHLYPASRPQERILNPFYYLSRYDDAFLEAVNESSAGAVLP